MFRYETGKGGGGREGEQSISSQPSPFLTDHQGSDFHILLNELMLLQFLTHA